MALHVSISAENIAFLGPLVITNSMFTGILVSLLLLLFVFYFYSQKPQIKRVTRLQALVELIIEGIYNLTADIAGAKKAREFFPLIATSIIFILFNNWFGLLPGVGPIGVPKPNHSPENGTSYALTSQAHALETSADSHSLPETSSTESSSGHSIVPLFRASTADLNTTLALAIISVFLTQYYGVKYLGLSYFTKFFNFKQGPIFTFVGILELISEFAKVISFAFRLFGNIFAGEVLLAVIAFLIPVIAPIPFLGLEIFVGFIQALVFGMLTLVFINMATVGHQDH